MTAQDFLNGNKDRFLNELFDLLRIPSISADPAYKDDVIRCAESVADHLRKAGADNVEVMTTPGYPVVYGERISTPICPPSWFMATTMCSRQIHLICGRRPLLSR